MMADLNKDSSSTEMMADLNKDRVMVNNATLNNISVMLWRSVLLVEESEYPEKTTDFTIVKKLSNIFVVTKVDKKNVYSTNNDY
jgi:hypothetical protein